MIDCDFDFFVTTGVDCVLCVSVMSYEDIKVWNYIFNRFKIWIIKCYSSLVELEVFSIIRSISGVVYYFCKNENFAMSRISPF